jgi:aldose 1-epimerase
MEFLYYHPNRLYLSWRLLVQFKLFYSATIKLVNFIRPFQKIETSFCMFLITDKTENGFNKIVISNMSTGVYAEVIPSCGAILHAYGIKKGAIQLNLIDSYRSAQEFENAVAGLGFKGCKLSPFVCRLKNGSYSFAGIDYTIEKFYLDAHAIHGLLYDACFSLQNINVEEDAASIEMQY